MKNGLLVIGIVAAVLFGMSFMEGTRLSGAGCPACAGKLATREYSKTCHECGAYYRTERSSLLKDVYRWCWYHIPFTTNHKFVKQ